MTTANKTSNSVLTEDTLKALEEFIEKGTPGEWEHDHEYVYIADRIICETPVFGIQANTNMGLICALRNNAGELLRGYRLGISLDKDRKP